MRAPLGITVVLTCLTIALSPTVGRGQSRDIAVGGGIGVTASARASGMAYHAAVNFPLAALPSPFPEPEPWDERRRRRPRPTAHLRTEVFYQGGTVTGSLFACDRVEPLYCLGRSDENRIAGAAVFVRIVSPWYGRFRFYIDPIGAGVYHRRTKSAELQGPTATCLIDGELVSCPNNPPWATFEYGSSRTSVGANTGLGIVANIGAARIFAEFRAHRLFESGESAAGAVPLTFGLVF
jgi:hypothetical protein